MRRNSLAAWLIAVSQLTCCHGSSIDLRIIGVVMRSGCVPSPYPNPPLTPPWPWFACPSRLGAMRTTSPFFVSALNEQPTPQYAHVVVVTLFGAPSWMSDFSVSASVGHDSMHAPHDTHSDARNGSFWLAETFELK